MLLKDTKSRYRNTWDPVREQYEFYLCIRKPECPTNRLLRDAVEGVVEVEVHVWAVRQSGSADTEYYGQFAVDKGTMLRTKGKYYEKSGEKLERVCLVRTLCANEVSVSVKRRFFTPEDWSCRSASEFYHQVLLEETFGGVGFRVEHEPMVFQRMGANRECYYTPDFMLVAPVGYRSIVVESKHAYEVSSESVSSSLRKLQVLADTYGVELGYRVVIIYGHGEKLVIEEVMPGKKERRRVANLASLVEKREEAKREEEARAEVWQLQREYADCLEENVLLTTENRSYLSQIARLREENRSYLSQMARLREDPPPEDAEEEDCGEGAASTGTGSKRPRGD